MINSFRTLLSLFLISDRFQLMLKLYVTFGTVRVLSVSILFAKFNFQHFPYVSIKLLDLSFHSGVLYTLYFIDSKVLICLLLLKVCRFALSSPRLTFVEWTNFPLSNVALPLSSNPNEIPVSSLKCFTVYISLFKSSLFLTINVYVKRWSM